MQRQILFSYKLTNLTKEHLCNACFSSDLEALGTLLRYCVHVLHGYLLKNEHILLYEPQ